MISDIEAGRTGLSEASVRQIAGHHECDDPALLAALVAMAGGRRARHWWDEYRGKDPDGHPDVSEMRTRRKRPCDPAGHPASRGPYMAQASRILYAEGPVAQHHAVQLDTSFGAHFIDAPTPSGIYRSLLNLMEGSALPPGESRELIR
ncbi:hypothetical protein [Streptomyces sp. 840.1]|uniref:hypothetical protein n=1 Tax=Streptomyces sp. 840.1 TaxID=2485152 RepID=UPI0021A796B7|nr:hypothetical protein [Streptomyces sp. 840.1]